MTHAVHKPKLSRNEAILANDDLRVFGRGGLILMTPAVYELPAWFRGRVLYRMTLCSKFTKDDHSEGVFVFGGWVFYWFIGEFAGQRALTLSMGEEWIGIRNLKALKETEQ